MSYPEHNVSVDGAQEGKNSPQDPYPDLKLSPNHKNDPAYARAAAENPELLKERYPFMVYEPAASAPMEASRELDDDLVQRVAVAIAQAEGHSNPERAAREYDSAARAAIAAVPSEAALGWRPIATAPRGGSSMLVFVPGERAGRRIQVGHCNVDGLLWTIGPYFSWDGFGSPTHWQPLPSPPSP